MKVCKCGRPFALLSEQPPSSTYSGPPDFRYLGESSSWLCECGKGFVFSKEELIMEQRELKIEACARAAHEANRAYCLALGDESQSSWDEAPDWQKSSARNGVLGVLQGNGPEESHIGWLAEKKQDGWKYGPVKDPSKKEHPCFVPYSELPPEQRKKDDIFVAVVRAVARASGLDFTIFGG